MPIDKLKEAGVEITKREEEMRAIAKQAEAVAKANLTAIAS
jgi:biotin operon repressor